MPTATADLAGPQAGRTRHAWIVPLVVLPVVALGLGIFGLIAGDGRSEPEPLAVDAVSIYDFASIDELVAASDVVVVGHVIAVDEGRLVGDPGTQAIRSRVASLDIDRVLLDRADEIGDVVLIEEEGWLADGTPLIVDGVAPTAVGDEGVWFLDATGDPEMDGYLVINSQGRYLVDPDDPSGALVGGDRDDPLVRQLEQLPLDELVAAVDAVSQTENTLRGGRRT